MEQPLSPLNCKDVVANFQRALELFQGDAYDDDTKLHFINELLPNQVEGLQGLLRLDGFTVPERASFQNTIGLLHSIQHRMRGCLKTGAGLQNQPAVAWNEIQSAFDRRIRTGAISNLRHIDLDAFLDDAEHEFENQVNIGLQEHNSLKVYGVLAAEFLNSKDVKEMKYFNTEAHEIYLTTPLAKWFKDNIQRPILNDIEEFQERDSGWTLHSIVNLTLNINKLNPMRGSSYITLPPSIENRGACINVKNMNDNECFRWAVLSALYPAQRDGQRLSKYENFKDVIKFGNIEFPVKPVDIKKFEKLNPWLSINLFMLEKRNGKFKVFPCYLTSSKQEKHINLLFVEDRYYEEDEYAQEEPKNYHYVWIKNLSALVGADLSKNHKKKHICDRCLHYFESLDRLSDHSEDCEKMNHCKVTLPGRHNNTLSFKNYKNRERVPFTIYADIECMLKPVEENDKICHEHVPYSISYYLQSSFDDNLSSFKLYRQKSDEDEKPAAWFVRNLLKHARELEKYYENPKPMTPLTHEEMTAYQSAKNCHVCLKPFTQDSIKVRDHDHFTGRYRGPAHTACNINFKDSRIIPIIMHNLSGYDAHFIIEELANAVEGSITLLPLTKEKYISFTKKIKGSKINLRFIDSYRFLASSLQTLADTLTKHKVTDRILSKKYNVDQIRLLKKKGCFPYEHVSSLESLEETKLPPQECFTSTLTDSTVSEHDYKHAEAVWEAFDVQTLGDYSDIYLQTDVLLLADIFESFRDSCIGEDSFGLDPAHYYTAPGFSWASMLKKTQIELELITDPDMMLFIQKGIRGGISQCSNRYSKANNPYMDNYDPNQDLKYLMYFDVTNLYGWAMTQALPYDSFRWVTGWQLEIGQNFFFDVPDDNEYGYILEVDLEYPEHLHGSDKDLPFCPEHRAAPETKDKKLMTTLYHKEKYVIHYRALKQALKHGLVLKKIHRAISFRQKPWLKIYVDFCTQKRRLAKNEFEKLLFKLLVNSVFGKTMEDETKRRLVKLISHWFGIHGAEALTARPNFKSQSIFKSNLVAIELALTEVSITKPVYVGLSVLDLSKTLVYRFHYDFMQPHLGDDLKLLYTDTDSLVYEIKNTDVYQIIKENSHEFDLSDYPPDNKFGITPNQENKKKVGVMKDECNARVMTEFAGLRSKCYSVRVEGEDAIKKSKDVKSCVVKNTICFDDYLECLTQNCETSQEQLNIRSKLHEVHTVKQTKIALSPNDTKRFLLGGTTDTLPWGHRDIPTEIEMEGVPQPVEGEPIRVEGADTRVQKKAPRRKRVTPASGQPARKRSKKQQNGLRKN